MRSLLVAVLAILIASPIAAQKGVPKRPSLPSGADTLSARSYYDLGAELLDTRPASAADAFYWASRLNPTWAEPLYARRIALLAAIPRRLAGYLEGTRSVLRAGEVRRIDSLQYHALRLDPYLQRRYDVMLFRHWARDAYRDELATGRVSAQAVDNWMDTSLKRGSSGTRAWFFASTGRLEQALSDYAAAIRSSKDRATLHAERGRIFHLVCNGDSARAELQRAVESRRDEDEKDFVRLYESKAVWEHSIGLSHEQSGDRAAAIEAYGRALQEDLSYWPAHVRMAMLAQAAGDTAAAAASLQLAVEADEVGILPRLLLGELLITLGRPAEARERLAEVVKLEPWFAAPHYGLARAWEAEGDTAQAITAYRRFLEMAQRNTPERERAETRLKALGGSE